jgi:hypothetical protein
MNDDLHAKLTRDEGAVLWSDLRAHAKRQGLFVVTGELTVAEAALAIASDDAASVQAWLASGHLFRPSLEQLLAWDQDLDKPFRAVVVQPFAIAREQAPDEPQSPPEG